MIMGISYVCLVEKCLTGFVGAPHKASFDLCFDLHFSTQNRTKMWFLRIPNMAET